MVNHGPTNLVEDDVDDDADVDSVQYVLWWGKRVQSHHLKYLSV